MRTIVGFGVALLLTLGLWAGGRVARASEAQRAVDEANAALAARPPQRAAAHGALERALTAGDDPTAVSEACFRLGALEEEDEVFDQAVVHYRQSLGAKPVSSGVPWARDASKRMQWLSVRSEGNYKPLARLRRFQQDPANAANPEAIAAFARDVEVFPPGIVRAESRLLVADAWLGPLHRPGEAAGLYRRVATDPTADGTTLGSGARGLVDALLADGQLDAAAKEIKAHAVQLEPDVVTRLEHLVRRRTVLRGAEIALAALVGLAALALAFARWKQGSLREALRATRTPARVVGALWCALSAIAAAFVLIGALAPTYLERIGL